MPFDFPFDKLRVRSGRSAPFVGRSPEGEVEACPEPGRRAGAALRIHKSIRKAIVKTRTRHERDRNKIKKNTQDAQGDSEPYACIQSNPTRLFGHQFRGWVCTGRAASLGRDHHHPVGSSFVVVATNGKDIYILAIKFIYNSIFLAEPT